MLREFKEFAMRGNVVDMAVGIIIGAAFGKIVTSAVNDIIMPPIGLVLGRVNFNDLFLSLDGKTYASLTAAKAASAPTINYGSFVNTILEMNRAMPPAAAVTKECNFCASAIAVKATRCPNCTSQLAA